MRQHHKFLFALTIPSPMIPLLVSLNNIFLYKPADHSLYFICLILVTPFNKTAKCLTDLTMNIEIINVAVP